MRSPGYTLIELLVVIALIGLVTLFALPSVTSFFKITLNSATREIATTIKETFNSTILTGKIHRVVYDFKNSEFWVESAPPDALLHTEKSVDKEKRRRKFLNLSPEPESPFQLDASITRKKISLPRGVEFKAVYTSHSDKPITEGIAYTHFFPVGHTEPTLVHIEDGQQHKISIIISGLVGRTRVVNGYVERREAFAH